MLFLSCLELVVELLSDESVTKFVLQRNNENYLQSCLIWTDTAEPQQVNHALTELDKMVDQVKVVLPNVLTATIRNDLGTLRVIRNIFRQLLLACYFCYWSRAKNRYDSTT